MRIPMSQEAENLESYLSQKYKFWDAPETAKIEISQESRDSATKQTSHPESNNVSPAPADVQTSISLGQKRSRKKKKQKDFFSDLSRDIFGTEKSKGRIANEIGYDTQGTTAVNKHQSFSQIRDSVFDPWSAKSEEQNPTQLDTLWIDASDLPKQTPADTVWIDPPDSNHLQPSVNVSWTGQNPSAPPKEMDLLGVSLEQDLNVEKRFQGDPFKPVAQALQDARSSTGANVKTANQTTNPDVYLQPNTAADRFLFQQVARLHEFFG
eukprot:Gregarina_sp_Poly_1__6595@NODE_353_length_9300_cov_96_781761_g295_i0_p5_GENE_NODE_353_length_9300_cov_96_781761_g295_i0NODE_353_length_9300_cov_96_781761_g295_i0_p5_ORF_typecomplete_len266_score48_37_NODE_353_length_9300_cov_96_781761_g295_i046655462